METTNNGLSLQGAKRALETLKGYESDAMKKYAIGQVGGLADGLDMAITMLKEAIVCLEMRLDADPTDDGALAKRYALVHASFRNEGGRLRPDVERDYYAGLACAIERAVKVIGNS